MPSFLVCLEVHPLPESPPPEDREDKVLFIWEDGHTETHPADSWTPDWFAEEPVAWAERLVLPAPRDRLTTEDVERVLRFVDGTDRGGLMRTLDAAARLRHAIENSEVDRG
jgi:hypothetical protein